jgi:CRISPR/Cas system type I-B associated protein Csh2 (Cas7 group RAMP superfamily)
MVSGFDYLVFPVLRLVHPNGDLLDNNIPNMGDEGYGNHD